MTLLLLLPFLLLPCGLYTIRGTAIKHGTHTFFDNHRADGVVWWSSLSKKRKARAIFEQDESLHRADAGKFVRLKESCLLEEIRHISRRRGRPRIDMYAQGIEDRA
jgi:hypothetical protein